MNVQWQWRVILRRVSHTNTASAWRFYKRWRPANDAVCMRAAVHRSVRANGRHLLHDCCPKTADSHWRQTKHDRMWQRLQTLAKCVTSCTATSFPLMRPRTINTFLGRCRERNTISISYAQSPSFNGTLKRATDWANGLLWLTEHSDNRFQCQSEWSLVTGSIGCWCDIDLAKPRDHPYRRVYSPCISGRSTWGVAGHRRIQAARCRGAEAGHQCTISTYGILPPAHVAFKLDAKWMRGGQTNGAARCGWWTRSRRCQPDVLCTAADAATELVWRPAPRGLRACNRDLYPMQTTHRDPYSVRLVNLRPPQLGHCATTLLW